MSSPSTPMTPPSDKTSAPPRPPKIPPPPSNDPPPYTPYNDPRATLLPQPAGPSPAAVRPGGRPNVVRPTGYRRITSYLTKKNCIICAAIVGVLFISAIAFNYWLSLEEVEKPKIVPLQFDSRNLARFHIPDQRISYDELTDSIILSKFLPVQRQLKSEKLILNEYDVGFLSAVQDIEGDNYEDCMRFTDHVVCCETGVSSRHHKTDCWQRREEDIVRVHAAFYDFVKEWQSLENEQTAIFLYNPQRHAVLHFEPNKIYQIDENRLPEGAISIGFHFPMNTVDELEELVRSENEFKICQYLLEDNEKYVLKDDNCKGTNFEVEYELNQVRFCSNPLYEAVVQYGHYRNEDQLSWRLRVAYESSDYIYEAHDRIHSPVDQLAMDCNDQAIDLYVLGGQQLIEFAVKLPDETNAHFKKRRLRSLRNRNETNFHFIDRKLQLQQKYPPPYFSDEKIIMLGDLRANASIF